MKAFWVPFLLSACLAPVCASAAIGDGLLYYFPMNGNVTSAAPASGTLTITHQGNPFASQTWAGPAIYGQYLSGANAGGYFSDASAETQAALLPYDSQQWTLAFWTRRGSLNVPLILANGAHPGATDYSNGNTFSDVDLTCLADTALAKEGWAIYNVDGATTTRNVVLRFHPYEIASGQFDTSRVYSLVLPGFTVADSAENAKWEHLAIVCDGQRVTFYLNGSASGNAWVATGPAAANRTAQHARIATVVLPEGYAFYRPVSSAAGAYALRTNTGGQAGTAIDEMAVWNRPLTAYELGAIVSGGNATPARSLPELAETTAIAVSKALSFNFCSNGQALYQGVADTGLTGAAPVPEKNWNNVPYGGSGSTQTLGDVKDENGCFIPVTVTMRGGNGSSSNTSNGITTPNGRLMRSHVWSRTKWEIILENLPENLKDADAYIYIRDGGSTPMRALHVGYPDGMPYTETAANYWYWDADLRKAFVSDNRFNLWNATYAPPYQEGRPLMDGTDYLCAPGVSPSEDGVLRISGWRGIDDPGVPGGTGGAAALTFPHLVGLQLVERGLTITLDPETETALSAYDVAGQSIRVGGSGTLLVDGSAAPWFLTVEGDAALTLKPTDGTALTLQGFICNAPAIVVDVSALTVDEATLLTAATTAGLTPEITLTGANAGNYSAFFADGTLSLVPRGYAYERTLSGGTPAWSDAGAYTKDGTSGGSWASSIANTLALTLAADTTLTVDTATAFESLAVTAAAEDSGTLTLAPAAEGDAAITVKSATLDADVALAADVASLGALTLGAGRTLSVAGDALPFTSYARQGTSTLLLSGVPTLPAADILFGKGTVHLAGTHAFPNSLQTLIGGSNGEQQTANNAVLKITGAATAFAFELVRCTVDVDGGTLTMTRSTTSANLDSYGIRVNRGSTLLVQNGGKLLCENTNIAPAWDNAAAVGQPSITVTGAGSLLKVKGFAGDNVAPGGKILIEKGAVLSIGSYGYVPRYADVEHDIAFSNGTLTAHANWSIGANNAASFRSISGTLNTIDPAGYSIVLNRPFTGWGSLRLISTAAGDAKGRVTFNAANTMTGTLTVAEGVTLGGVGSLTGPLTFEDGAILRKTSTNAAEGLTVAGALTLPENGTVTVALPDTLTPEKGVNYYLLKGAGATARQSLDAFAPPTGTIVARDATGIYLVKPTGLFILLY